MVLWVVNAVLESFAFFLFGDTTVFGAVSFIVVAFCSWWLAAGAIIGCLGGIFVAVFVCGSERRGFKGGPLTWTGCLVGIASADRFEPGWAIVALIFLAGGLTSVLRLKVVPLIFPVSVDIAVSLNPPGKCRRCFENSVNRSVSEVY